MKKFIHSINPGLLLIGFGGLAMVWTNTPIFESYFALAHFEIDLHWIGIAMPLEEFVRDFVLAIFFFSVGLELKQEFSVGSLRDPKRAALPIIAAVGGMLAPCAIYLGTLAVTGNLDFWKGFAIPTATDIAFSVGILALVGKNVNTNVRIFLLTLAVADDILGILVIAFGYSAAINFMFLGLCVVILVAWFFVVRMNSRVRFVLLPILGLAFWYCMFFSGVHSAISGVCLGLCVTSRIYEDQVKSRAMNMLQKVEPISNLIVLPIFAFFQLGVRFDGIAFGGQEISLLSAVALALLLGKPIGIMLFTVLAAKVAKFPLPKGLRYRDYLGVACLAGTGFTVSFLVAVLSFESDSMIMIAKTGVVIGSIGAALLATLVIKLTKPNHAPEED